ncbi:electron transport complex protein RnfD [Hydrogenispora ethanolica]|jgi:electron transport complex protein RnfD|uniref:Ion-translocating oxidoreductase complex subunit D n=1 Tax=Hydrogenispora ethanolica TaxID=1082276 RepID=A0A4R1S1Y7_HYDET|nr:RnfABCDGE type electron transport complex subunit D [Hydrogenispora ethanolica]TCL73173.1 electron transport complex protein RnfD [Hydrogenispora ethanolica]
MKFTLAPSPHLKSPESTASIMRTVFLSLTPAGLWSVWRFGIRAAWVILVAVGSCLAIEYLAQRFVFKTAPRTGDGSAAVTGLLLAYCLPPGIPLWQVPIGAFAAIFITKECFGGIGFNIFNPALIGRAVLLASFPVAMTRWQIDGVTMASPLGLLKEKLAETPPSYLDLFLGNVPGSLGEVSKLLLLLGALFLLYRGIISWEIPVGYIATVFLVSPLFGQDPLYQILAGGLFLGAFFMATDYVTSPLFRKGKLIFAIGCGLLTVLIRNRGAFPEGVCYSILIMNMLTPLIDKYTKPRSFGAAK